MVFEILVHDPAEEDWDNHPSTSLTLEEWLELRGDLGWNPDPDEVGIRFLLGDGAPWQRDGWAPLSLLERMCVEAARRLSLGQPGLLRSVQDDVAAWILLDPVGDRVDLAVLRDMESPFSADFPVADLPGQRASDVAALHAYVAARRDRLVAPLGSVAADRAHLRGCHLARGLLIAALASAAADAARVRALLGR